MSVVSETWSVMLHQLHTSAHGVAMSIGSALEKASALAGVAAFVGSLAAAIGVTINPPWVTQEQFTALKQTGETTQKTIETMQRQLTEQIRRGEAQNCVTLQLLKDRYLKEQLDAQNELNKNPTSPTLQRARDEAKANVENVDAEQRVARCLRLRAPISSFMAPNQTVPPLILVPSTRWLPLKL